MKDQIAALHNPEFVARKIDSVYADLSLEELLAHGSPRDILLFKLRCQLVISMMTCAALKKGRGPGQLKFAVETYGAESV